MRRVLPLVFCLALPAAAADIEVSGAKVQSYPVALAPPISTEAGLRQRGQEVAERVRALLQLTGMIKILDPASFLAPADEGIEPKKIQFEAWRQIGAKGLLKFALRRSQRAVVIEYLVFDVRSERPLANGTLQTGEDRLENLAGQLADAILLGLTGEPGPFRSQIAFVRQSGRHKTVWISDPDGARARLITPAKGLHILPAWGPGGQSVYFTSYAARKPHLYRMPIRGGRWTAVSRRKGINTGAKVSPVAVTVDGKTYPYLIALTLSKDGNAEIYLISLKGDIVKRVTNHWGIDSSPTWSPDGKQLAFVSERGGTPQIYVSKVDGSELRRVTWKGDYNQTPAWSPRGDLIAFVGRDERNAFDIFTVATADGNVKRLTQAEGNNEEPTWAPNGRLIAFTSTRGEGRTQRVWVMREDGRHATLVSGVKGRAFTPRWSPFLP
ncbi:MAG TPA: translocation protein TolB [Myxococcales bacterium]|nr:translocation protein TolB [Myxococcales bacterium]MBF95321.1 translocation protein TolB [Myxococcales bacterium]HBU47533.1 translocation protein TolB [Myxococcales bacterium]